MATVSLNLEGWDLESLEYLELQRERDNTTEAEMPPVIRA